MGEIKEERVREGLKDRTHVFGLLGKAQGDKGFERVGKLAVERGWGIVGRHPHCLIALGCGQRDIKREREKKRENERNEEKNSRG